jgi:beta-glucosidase
MTQPATTPRINPSIPAARDDEHFIERHAIILKQINEVTIDLVFLGDSITRRWFDNSEIWNQAFGRWQPANFGVGGDAVQNVLWRIQHGELDGIKPRVLVLLIGTNNAPTNTGSEIAEGVRKVVEIIRAKLPETKILLLAIFPRGPQNPADAHADNPYYMDIIRTANAELARLDDGVHVRFLDFGSRFLTADGHIDTSLMPDQLHIITPGYQIWADAIQPLLEEMMS